MILGRLAPGFVTACLVAGGVGPCVAAQATPGVAPADHVAQQVPAPAGPGETTLPPVSFDRIRRALEREPTIRLPEPKGAVFSVSIEARQPSFADFVGEDGLAVGPAPTTPAAHREFLALVAPPQTQSFGAFTPGELVQVAATSAAAGLGGQWLVHAIRDAVRSRREQEARREVQAVLAELERRERERKQEEEKRDQRQERQP